MNLRKFISGVSAFAIAASAFAGLAVTANAEDLPYATDPTLGNLVAKDDFSATPTTYSGGDYKQSGDFVMNSGQWSIKPSWDETNQYLRMGNSTGNIVIPDDYLAAGADDVVTIKFKVAYGYLTGNRQVDFTISDSNGTEVAYFCRHTDKSSPSVTTTTYRLGDSANAEDMPSDGDFYFASKEPNWERAVSYTFTIDFGKGTVTEATSCYKEGTGKAATIASHTQNLPSGVTDIKTLSIHSNYNNSDRRAIVDDIEMWTTKSKDALAPTTVTISGADAGLIGSSAARSYAYTAAVLDQNSNAMTEETVTFSIDSAPEGVTFADGKLNVPAGTTPGTVVLKATSDTDNTVYATKNITLTAASQYTATVDAYLGSKYYTTYSNTADEDRTTDVYYPKFIRDNDGTYYEKTANSNYPTFGVRFNAAGNETVTYAASNVDYAADFEDLTPSAQYVANSSYAERFSGGIASRLGKGAYVTIPWQHSVESEVTVFVYARNNSSRGDSSLALQLYDGESYTDAGTMTWSTTSGASKTITVPAGSKIVIKNTDANNNSNVELDYISITVTSYAVTAATGLTNGSVSVDKATAKPGETVTVTATPENGYVLDKITVNGNEISGTSFTMPNEAVTVSATFTAAAPVVTDPSATATWVKDYTDSTTDGIEYDHDTVASVWAFVVDPGTYTINKIGLKLNGVGNVAWNTEGVNITNSAITFPAVFNKVKTAVESLALYINNDAENGYTVTID